MKRLKARAAAAFEGLSPESAALALAAGLVLGTFPIYGCPTVLCALASVLFGVNIPAVQVVNQLVTPLQLALLVPFVRVGARLIGAPKVAGALWGMGAPALQAVAGWALLAGPCGLLLYFTLARTLRRFEGGRLVSAPAR